MQTPGVKGCKKRTSTTDDLTLSLSLTSYRKKRLDNPFVVHEHPCFSRNVTACVSETENLKDYWLWFLWVSWKNKLITAFLDLDSGTCCMQSTLLKSLFRKMRYNHEPRKRNVFKHEMTHSRICYGKFCSLWCTFLIFLKNRLTGLFILSVVTHSWTMTLLQRQSSFVQHRRIFCLLAYKRIKERKEDCNKTSAERV